MPSTPAARSSPSTRTSRSPPPSRSATDSSTRWTPTRWDLDEVSPNNPVFLQDFSRHTSWVNSAALALAAVDETIPLPPGSLMPTGEDGLLTGIVMEGAQALVQRVL